MPKRNKQEFDPELHEYWTVEIPYVAYTTVSIQVPKDFDLDHFTSEEYPDFDPRNIAFDKLRNEDAWWNLDEDEPMEFEEEEAQKLWKERQDGEELWSGNETKAGTKDGGSEE